MGRLANLPDESSCWNSLPNFRILDVEDLPKSTIWDRKVLVPQASVAAVLTGTGTISKKNKEKLKF